MPQMSLYKNKNIHISPTDDGIVKYNSLREKKYRVMYDELKTISQAEYDKLYLEFSRKTKCISH